MTSTLSSRPVVAALLMAALAIGLLPSQALAEQTEASEKCAALRGNQISPAAIGLPTRGAVVDTADVVLASAANPYGEYCLAQGKILSIDPAAQNIQFAVALPTAWNHWTVQLGGGGENGTVIMPNDPRTPAHSIVMPPPLPLARGYVAYGSDSGHQGKGGDTAYRRNAEELANFSGDQVKKTHDVAMELVQRRYGRLPDHSLHAGGSTGGYEAMVAIARFPDDYDGAIIWSPGIVQWTNWYLKGLLIGRAMTADHGAGFIRPPQFAYLRTVVLAACDKLDGLEDGIVSNIDVCHVDFRRLECPAGSTPSDTCFTAPQIRTLDQLFSTATLPYSAGAQPVGLYGYALGADFEHAPGADAANPERSFFPDQIDHNLQEWTDKPGDDLMTLDPLKPSKAFLAKIKARAKQEDWADIDRFVARGGKIILVNGLADFAASPAATTAQYQRLVKRYGQAKADSFVRFYLIPGYSHGSGIGFNANGQPTLPALEHWIDTGEAPGNLVMVDVNPAAKGRTRPMCLYPTWARYNGEGDPDRAASFACVK